MLAYVFWHRPARRAGRERLRAGRSSAFTARWRTSAERLSAARRVVPRRRAAVAGRAGSPQTRAGSRGARLRGLVPGRRTGPRSGCSRRRRSRVATSAPTRAIAAARRLGDGAVYRLIEGQRAARRRFVHLASGLSTGPRRGRERRVAGSRPCSATAWTRASDGPLAPLPGARPGARVLPAARRRAAHGGRRAPTRLPAGWRARSVREREVLCDALSDRVMDTRAAQRLLRAPGRASFRDWVGRVDPRAGARQRATRSRPAATTCTCRSPAPGVTAPRSCASSRACGRRSRRLLRRRPSATSAAGPSPASPSCRDGAPGWSGVRRPPARLGIHGRGLPPERPGLPTGGSPCRSCGTRQTRADRQQRVERHHPHVRRSGLARRRWATAPARSPTRSALRGGDRR